MNDFRDQLQPLKNQENLYDKDHKTFVEQLELLKKRDLVISNEAYVLTKLKHINYYRLSAYFLPFQYEKDSPNKDHFLPDTTFEDIIRLYYFDTELRKIIFEAIEVIEIYMRTQIAYHHSKKFGAFGYLDIRNLRQHLTNCIRIFSKRKRVPKRFLSGTSEKSTTLLICLCGVSWRSSLSVPCQSSLCS